MDKDNRASPVERARNNPIVVAILLAAALMGALSLIWQRADSFADYVRSRLFYPFAADEELIGRLDIGISAGYVRSMLGVPVLKHTLSQQEVHHSTAIYGVSDLPTEYPIHEEVYEREPGYRLYILSSANGKIVAYGVLGCRSEDSQPALGEITLNKSRLSDIDAVAYETWYLWHGGNAQLGDFFFEMPGGNGTHAAAWLHSGWGSYANCAVYGDEPGWTDVEFFRDDGLYRRAFSGDENHAGTSLRERAVINAYFVADSAAYLEVAIARGDRIKYAGR